MKVTLILHAKEVNERMNEIRNFLNLKNQQKDYSDFDLTKAANEEIGHLNEEDGIDCPICRNKGYIWVDDENGMQNFKSCQCMIKRKVKRITKESGMNDLLDYRLRDFETDLEWQKNIAVLAYRYIKTNSKDWFCMLGQSGSGKTHICSAICNALMNTYCVEVRYIAWNTFASDYKDDFKAGAEQMKILQNVPVLYVDDFLKGANSDFDIKNIAFDLINYRYVKKLKTIISSELMFRDIMKADEAIAGRIKQMCGEYAISIQKSKTNNYRLRGVKN